MSLDFRTDRLVDLVDSLHRREVSARELTEHALERIERLDPKINAFVSVDGERAMEDAASIDEARAAGTDVGGLAGIPIGVKDLEDAIGFPTTNGSATCANAAPATVDSPLVARLRDAGCVVVGKTNTPEHGWKADTENLVFGATRNPHNLDRSAGGSSGGSAAALAAGMVPLATGSDGGGSIRIPSAICGLSSMKPSAGRIPNATVTPPTWLHLSTKGPMARRIGDVTYALDIVIGPDPLDRTSLPMPHASWHHGLGELHPPARALWCPSLGYATVDDEVLAAAQRAVDALAAAGTEIIEIDEVFGHDPVREWLVLSAGGNLRSLLPYRDDGGWEQLDPNLKTLLEWAEQRSGLAVLDALDECHRLNARLVELFHEAPLLICPVTAGHPGPPGGEGTVNGEESLEWVALTYPFNLIGSPAGTVPMGRNHDGVPMGLQVVGPTHGDMVVLRALAFLEQLLGDDADLIAPLPA